MKYVVLFSVIALALAGCTKKAEKELWQSAVEMQKRNEVDDAIQGYLRVLEEYPNGKLAPEALYAIGTLYQNEKQDKSKAVEFYQRLVREYSDHATAPNAAFMIGFIYHNDLKKVEEARRAYEEFLSKYPSSTMAESARFELATLGKSPEEILRQQEAKARTEKPAAAKNKRAPHAMPGR